MNFKDKASLTGLITTILVHVAVILVLIFMAFITPLPLPGEEGVEVMLGSSGSGSSNDMLYEIPNVRPETPSQPKPSQPESVATSNSDEEIFMPDDTQEADKNDEADKAEDNEVIQEQEIVHNEPEREREPIVNPNALYRGSSSDNNNNQSGSVGNNENAGSIFGNPDSTNESGLGGAGGGISFSLEGRSHIHLPKPIYDSQEQGRIVVEIQVNKRGDVIKAVAGKAGTTISDQKLWAKTEEAAMKTKFSPNPKASEIQIGTITYNFRRMNE